MIANKLGLLVDGLVGLKDEGRFHEPNLNGTPGDYISFHSWEWPQGVGLYGLFRLWQHTGEDRLLAIIEEWYDRAVQKELPDININTTAPMLTLSLLWEATGNERWRPILDDWADRAMRDLPRTPEDGFQHVVSDSVNAGQLWDDTLFMLVLFLAHFGKKTNRPDLVDEAVRQFLLHAKYLIDTETGLWFHGWTFDGRHNFARARWARGNAWITAGLLDFLDMAEPEGGVRQFLLGCFKSQTQTLLGLQHPCGAWHTLLDDPDSYVEISATAAIAYGFLKACRLGILDEPYREAGMKALHCVLNNIDEAGVVQNVSYGTRMGRDLQFYRDVPLQPTAYGQALALLLLSEAVRHDLG